MSKYISPIVTSVLVGAVAWVIDSIIFAVGMPSVSISGALLTEVSLLRLSVRLLMFLCCLLAGVYAGYMAGSRREGELFDSFKADELFTNADYLAESSDGVFSGDDTLRGSSYVESVSKNRHVDVTNRPIYFSDHIRKNYNQVPNQNNVKPVHPKAESADLKTELYGAIQRNEAQLLWQYCGRLGSALKLNVQELSMIRSLCYGHDIGRFADGADDDNHMVLGAELAKGIPDLAAASNLILTHHEKWDGSGPMGLSGLDIPLGSRIFALAWVYNAFTKPYGAWRLSNDDALDMLQMYAGTALDPELVAVFVGMHRQHSLAHDGMLEGSQLRQIG